MSLFYLQRELLFHLSYCSEIALILQDVIIITTLPPPRLSQGVCWMEHVELELEAYSWWFCSRVRPPNAPSSIPPVVRIPGVMKKFDQNANFQNCDQGVEILFSVTFRDIPKIDNSHLAPNVCFGNDIFF